MSQFLVIKFQYREIVYQSLILCKAESESPEYRITVMNGNLEKQLCNNNTIKEIKGCLQIETSGDNLQDELKMEIAKSLGSVIKKPVKEVETFG